MNTLDTYTCTDSWGLVYDAASSGDFIGTIQEITGYRSLCYIGSGIPGNDNAGFVLSGGFLQISVNAANKLYAKRYPGDPYSMPKLSLAMANITVVGGAVAVGSAPTANPVGVSGIDGSGLKRSLLTDATGKLTTVTPDCADVSGSVSSADVLFTLDLLNYPSASIQIISPGTSCSIVFESSYNGTTDWTLQAGFNTSATSSGSVVQNATTTASSYTFAKRSRYLRARVSVYGSGTVSAVGSAIATQVPVGIGAFCMGTAGEGTQVAAAPVTIAAETRTTSKSSVGNGTVTRPIATRDGRLIMRPHSIPENEWAYAPPSGGLVNSTAEVVVKAAAGANIRNYITSVQVMAEALTNATDLTIEDGDGTVLWRTKITTAGLPTVPIRFDDPIKGTANASLQIRTVTASGTGAVYVNAQGYIAP